MFCSFLNKVNENRKVSAVRFFSLLLCMVTLSFLIASLLSRVWFTQPDSEEVLVTWGLFETCVNISPDYVNASQYSWSQ
eukprot:Pgem_evm1s7051